MSDVILRRTSKRFDMFYVKRRSRHAFINVSELDAFKSASISSKEYVTMVYTHVKYLPTREGFISIVEYLETILEDERFPRISIEVTKEMGLAQSILEYLKASPLILCKFRISSDKSNIVICNGDLREGRDDAVCIKFEYDGRIRVSWENEDSMDPDVELCSTIVTAFNNGKESNENG